MGWKTINGRRYFYKSECERGRVKTTYFGAGESGVLISRFESMERAERETERDERRAEREEFAMEEKAVAEWFDDVQAVADAAMIAAGFHKQSGMRTHTQTQADGRSPKPNSNTAKSTKPKLDSCRPSGRWPKSASWPYQPFNSTSARIK